MRYCSCGTQLADSFLVCPACHSLVHAEKLGQLSRSADEASAQGRLADALGLWRDALELLPPGTRQAAAISEKIDALSARVDEEPASGGRSFGGGSKWAGGGVIAAVAFAAWKFKALLVFAVTKGKLLLLGLTKSSTLFSMLLSMGVYMSIWGWPFAVGLIVSIYIHEMGHVAALTRYGIRATAPMFIPGVGAVVRLKQYPVSPREDARVGLAGPVWGLGAALASLALSAVMDSPMMAAIARAGAWINLFNLLPLATLDGGRGFRALSRRQRWICAGAIVLLWFTTHESLLFLLGIAAVVQAMAALPAPTPDQRSFFLYLFLLASLSFLCLVPVSVTP